MQSGFVHITIAPLFALGYEFSLLNSSLPYTNSTHSYYPCLCVCCELFPQLKMSLPLHISKSCPIFRVHAVLSSEQSMQLRFRPDILSSWRLFAQQFHPGRWASTVSLWRPLLSWLDFIGNSPHWPRSFPWVSPSSHQNIHSMSDPSKLSSLSSQKGEIHSVQVKTERASLQNETQSSCTRMGGTWFGSFKEETLGGGGGHPSKMSTSKGSEVRIIKLYSRETVRT